MIISILGHRNAAQRKLIRQVYAETYGEDLLKALDKELTSDFEVWFRVFSSLLYGLIVIGSIVRNWGRLQ